MQGEAPLQPTAATLATEPSASPINKKEIISRNRRNQQGSGVIGQVSIQHRSSKEGSLLLQSKKEGQVKVKVDLFDLTSKFQDNSNQK